MIKIGEFNELTISRETPHGYYLTDVDGEEVLFPRKYISPSMKKGDLLKVIVYLDSGNLPVATLEKPLLTLGQFASLQVNTVNDVGAFCDWGVTKELFIPYRNQAFNLTPNRNYVVHMYFDEKSDRLVGSTKISPYLKHVNDGDLERGQEVDLIMYSESDLGYAVIINQKYSGLIYDNEVHEILRVGQTMKGYVKLIREDGKIDISLTPIGHKSIEPNAQKILTILEKNQGFLPFTDKSDPIMIRKRFGISKKLFKKSLGSLYKQKIVDLKDDGIYLIKEA